MPFNWLLQIMFSFEPKIRYAKQNLADTADFTIIQSTFRIIEALICNENALALLYPQKKIMKGLWLCSQGNNFWEQLQCGLDG